jgi:hypothetical protein
MMNVKTDNDCVTFFCDGRAVGEYVLNDPYKPHFRSLRTPAGHETTLVSPGDHRHHKGLMYALRCEDLNFWEEIPREECGVQTILDTKLMADGSGIVQDLLWTDMDGGKETYREERRISATHEAASSAFVYTWHTRRTALRDHRLVKSPWSMKMPDGRRINYHGLGFRPPWMWCFPLDEFGAVEVNGTPCDPMEACGQTAEAVGFWGLIDGQWERTKAAVTLGQPAGQGFTWFVLKKDFPYLSVGPSNAEELDISAGEVFEEHYTVRVEDRT